MDFGLWSLGCFIYVYDIFLLSLREFGDFLSSEAMSKKYLGETLDIHGGGLGNSS